MKQVYYASIDLALHDVPPATFQALLGVDRGVQNRTFALMPPPQYRQLWSFSHIFSGGYAAGYYGWVMGRAGLVSGRQAGLQLSVLLIIHLLVPCIVQVQVGGGYVGRCICSLPASRAGEYKAVVQVVQSAYNFSRNLSGALLLQKGEAQHA